MVEGRLATVLATVSTVVTILSPTPAMVQARLLPSRLTITAVDSVDTAFMLQKHCSLHNEYNLSQSITQILECQNIIIR